MQLVMTAEAALSLRTLQLLCWLVPLGWADPVGYLPGFDWEECVQEEEDENHMKVRKLHVALTDTGVSMTGSGDVYKDFTNGTFKLVVKSGGINLAESTGDVCQEGLLPCPMRSGSFSESRIVPFEQHALENLPSGYYKLKMMVWDQDEEPFACVKGSLQYSTEAITAAPPTSKRGKRVQDTTPAPTVATQQQLPPQQHALQRQQHKQQPQKQQQHPPKQHNSMVPSVLVPSPAPFNLPGQNVDKEKTLQAQKAYAEGMRKGYELGVQLGHQDGFQEGFDKAEKRRCHNSKQHVAYSLVESNVQLPVPPSQLPALPAPSTTNLQQPTLESSMFMAQPNIVPQQHPMAQQSIVPQQHPITQPNIVPQHPVAQQNISPQLQPMAKPNIVPPPQQAAPSLQLDKRMLMSGMEMIQSMMQTTSIPSNTNSQSSASSYFL